MDEMDDVDGVGDGMIVRSLQRGAVYPIETGGRNWLV